MSAKPEIRTQDEVQIGVEVMLKFTREEWEGVFGKEHPLTPANALAHVMSFFDADRKYGAGVEVQSLETTGPDGEPIDENEGI